MSLLKAVRAKKEGQQSGLLVTPRMVEWLTENGRIPPTEEMAEVATSILTDGSNDIRHSRFGASSRGTCLRAQLFAYLGMPGQRPLDYLLNNIFADGSMRHLRWQLMGLSAGVFTHVEVGAKKPELNLGVSIDAVNTDEKWLFELKGAHMIPKEPPFNHILQIHTYFVATGYDTASYLVEDKRTNEWKEWVIKKDDEYEEAVLAELEELNAHLKAGTIPEVLDDCKSKQGPYRKCAFRKNCLSCTELPAEAGVWIK